MNKKSYIVPNIKLVVANENLMLDMSGTQGDGTQLSKEFFDDEDVESPKGVWDE